MNGNTLFSMVWLVICVIFILCAAYLFTRYVVGRGGNLRTTSRGYGQMRVVQRISTGRDQQLMVVQVGKQYFFIGMSGSQVTLLKEFAAEESEIWQKKEEGEESAKPLFGFTEAIQQILDGRGQR